MIIKDIFSVISRLIRLENRVSAVEKKVEKLQPPPKDLKVGLKYNKMLNLYLSETSGEHFCPTCLGNGKKIAIQIKSSGGEDYWYCDNCKSSGSSRARQTLPRDYDTTIPDY